MVGKSTSKAGRKTHDKAVAKAMYATVSAERNETFNLPLGCGRLFGTY